MKENPKIIINFCPTGMVHTKAMNPAVAISIDEIIEQTHEAYELGITVAHLHARELDETPAWNPIIFQKIFEGVRRYCPDLIICASTSGRTFSEFEKRSAVIELRPDMCSLTLSSLNFMDTESLNSPKMIKDLAIKMAHFGVHPELECFDLGMINYGKYLVSKDIIQGPWYWNLIFGNIAGMQASLEHISSAVKEILLPGHFFSLGGFGHDQLKVNALAIAMGYGVRIGLEDNLWIDKHRTEKASNIKLLKRIHSLIDTLGHQYYPAKELGKQGFYNNGR